MSKHYADWNDWAGDHPEQAERDLGRITHMEDPCENYGHSFSLASPTCDLCMAERPTVECEHTEVYSTGHCADCGTEVEGFEPSDAQIPGTYDIGKAAAA